MEKFVDNNRYGTIHTLRLYLNFLFFYFDDARIAKTLCDNYHEFTDEYGRVTLSVSQNEVNTVLGSEAKRQGYRLIVLS